MSEYDNYLMKRRTFLASAGSASVGASALIASGAFSRVESNRAVSIAVAEDSDAYLGLDKCDTPNGSYAWPDDDGHLAIQMNHDNPTHNGEKDDTLGAGINSNSTSSFDRVFQICNQGKEAVCVWIDEDNEWPRLDDGEGPRRVEFYLEADREASIIGEEYGVQLEVGQCVCIGISVRSHGLEDGDRLLRDLDDQITIIADVDGVCGRVPPEEDEEAGNIDGFKAITEGLEDYYDCIDLDEDGRLSGWTIELYEDDCETVIAATESNEYGYFQFTDLDPGTYCVCEEPSSGTVQIDPEDNSCHTVEVEAGETKTAAVDGETYAFLNGIAEFQGCSPGFWCQQPQRRGWWSDSESVGGWYTDDTIGDVFESEGWLKVGDGALSDLELGIAVCSSKEDEFGMDEPQRQLARQATAALLNAAHESIDYKFSESEVIDEVVDVLDDGYSEDVEDLKDTFDEYNNLDCPIDAHGDLEEEKA